MDDVHPDAAGYALARRRDRPTGRQAARPGQLHRESAGPDRPPAPARRRPSVDPVPAALAPTRRRPRRRSPRPSPPSTRPRPRRRPVVGRRRRPDRRRGRTGPSSRPRAPPDAHRSDRTAGGPPPAGPDLPDEFEQQGPHRPHPGPGDGRRGARGVGRVGQPVRPVLLPGDDRNLLAHPQGLPGPPGRSAATGGRSTS